MLRHLLLSIIMLFPVWAEATEVDRGEVEFSGYVIDKAARWVWQIATPDQTWDVDVADSIIDAQGNQVFSFTQKGTLPFLEGHLKEVAERGGSDMTPEIIFSSGGMPLAFTGGGAQSSRVHTFVPVRNADTGDEIGRLSFVLEKGMAIAQGRINDHAGKYPGLTGVAFTSADELSPGLTGRLLSLLMMNKGSDTAGIPGVLQGGSVSPLILSDNNLTNFAAAWASQLSDFRLSWPREKLPSRWQATLSVMVTLQ